MSEEKERVMLPDRITNKRDFRDIVELAKPGLLEKMAMEKDVVEKEAAFAMQIADKNPTLYQCTPVSVFYAISNIGSIGLTLNPALKLAYLIPRKNKGQMECNLAPSYMGLIKLCTDPGGVLVIEGGVILDGDDYDIQLGTGGYIKHRPLELIPRKSMTPEQLHLISERTKEDGKWGTYVENVVGAYSRAVLHNGAESIDFMPVERLQKIHRLMVKTARADAPATLWPDEWCKKTVIAHHTKTLPKSERAALAVQLTNQAEGLDMDRLPEYSERSIFSELQDGKDAPTECDKCGAELTGGVCMECDQ